MVSRQFLAAIERVPMTVVNGGWNRSGSRSLQRVRVKDHRNDRPAEQAQRVHEQPPQSSCYAATMDAIEIADGHDAATALGIWWQIVNPERNDGHAFPELVQAISVPRYDKAHEQV